MPWSTLPVGDGKKHRRSIYITTASFFYMSITQIKSGPAKISYHNPLEWYSRCTMPDILPVAWPAQITQIS